MRSLKDNSVLEDHHFSEEYLVVLVDSAEDPVDSVEDPVDLVEDPVDILVISATVFALQ